MLSLVLPTYNESENIPELIPRILKVLGDLEHEIIIVDDDSPDETWRIAHEMSESIDSLHVIRRIGRKGLSSAVIEGFLAAKGDVLAVMDADGQHDMDLLPRLYHAAQDNSGIAIGSRYIEGGSVGEWDERRHWMSRVATTLALSVCKVKANDPMSGFFALKRDLFERVVEDLNPKGFKILLDLLVCVPKETKVTELPFTFATRIHGESKLSRRVQIEFLEYLYDVTIGRYIPLSFVKYCLVGTLGIGVNVGSYAILSQYFTNGEDLTLAGFSVALLLAIEISIIFNFYLNNVWTFADQKLKGKGLAFGFLTFNAACAFGAFANLAVGAFLFSKGLHALVAVAIGAITSTFWNYSMNRLFTWRKN